MYHADERPTTDEESEFFGTSKVSWDVKPYSPGFDLAEIDFLQDLGQAGKSQDCATSHPAASLTELLGNCAYLVGFSGLQLAGNTVQCASALLGLTEDSPALRSTAGRADGLFPSLWLSLYTMSKTAGLAGDA
ncbi:unnamed protein product, partial [Amoebophrya sp. A120]|eukprot:GSA120T00005224001.1